MRVSGYRIEPHADLEGANLCGADLCGVYLCGADLKGANLCGADLCGVYLEGAKVSAETRGLWVAGVNSRGHTFAAYIGPSGTKNYLYGCRHSETLEDALAHYDNAYAAEHGEEVRQEGIALLESLA